MIINLRVKNAALIDEAEVEFGPGLNILTGETGAGKSILIDSINFMLGQRPGKDFIRSGADTAEVEGLISLKDPDAISAIREMGIEADEELLLARTLNSQGRSTCRVNGRSVTVSMLKEISSLLVDIHGQHEHQSLLNPAKHIVLLDRFCGEKLQTHKNNLASLISKYREISREIKNLQGGSPSQREAQIGILNFQKNELESASLKPGEEEELESAQNRLSAVDKLSKNAEEALFLLRSSDNVGKAQKLVTELARWDESKQGLAERLTDLSIQIADIAEELTDYTEGLDSDPLALERVEARLDVIYRLKKKYNAADTQGLLDQLVRTSDRLDKLEGSEEEINRLNSKRRGSIEAIAAKCNEMTALRREQAEMIQVRILEVLRDLGMKDVQFAISIEKQAAFSANGNDKLEFMISPNLGEPLKPLSQIASGGEMSRVMLALKTVMADVDRIGTLIFDEIDAGVSGRTAQQVAEKLVQIAGRHQLLCITHLPQIAAVAGTHFLIAKGVEQGQTVTRVRGLDYDGAVKELARLIGGAEITEAVIRAAGELKEMGAL